MWLLTKIILSEWCIMRSQGIHQCFVGMKERSYRLSIKPGLAVICLFIKHSQPVQPVNTKSIGIRYIPDMPLRLLEQEIFVSRVPAIHHNTIFPGIEGPPGVNLSSPERTSFDSIPLSRHLEAADTSRLIAIFPIIGFWSRNRLVGGISPSRQTRSH